MLAVILLNQPRAAALDHEVIRFMKLPGLDPPEKIFEGNPVIIAQVGKGIQRYHVLAGFDPADIKFVQIKANVILLNSFFLTDLD